MIKWDRGVAALRDFKVRGATGEFFGFLLPTEVGEACARFGDVLCPRLFCQYWGGPATPF